LLEKRMHVPLVHQANEGNEESCRAPLSHPQGSRLDAGGVRELKSKTKDSEQVNSMRRVLPGFLGGLLIVGVLTGCNTVYVSSKQYLGVPNYPPTDPASIQVLQTAPTRPHVRLGEITLQPQGNPAKVELEQKLRLAASKMGADAVVVVADRTMVLGTTVMGPWWGQTISPDVGRVIVGVAIRYTR
jgi:hypothetical protein